MVIPRTCLYLPVLLLLIACGSATSLDTRPKGIIDTSRSNMYSTKADDAGMNAAIAMARATLDRFDSALNSDKYDKGWNMLKVRFPTPSGGAEYIWLVDITRVNGHYQGIVTDSVYDTMQVRQGDTVTINQADITDWMFGTDSVIHGAYTTRVILSRMNAEERARYHRDVKYRIED